MALTEVDVKFQIIEKGDIITGISQTLRFEVKEGKVHCFAPDQSAVYWTGAGESRTKAILDWLHKRLGVSQ